MVSYKLKTILKKYKLPAYQFYPIPVLYNGKIIKYYWLHWIFNFWDHLDTEKSDLKRESKTQKIFLNKHLIFQKIVFKENSPKYDVFNINKSGKDIYFSEALINELNSKKVTIMVYSDYLELN